MPLYSFIGPPSPTYSKSIRARIELRIVDRVRGVGSGVGLGDRVRGVRLGDRVRGAGSGVGSGDRLGSDIRSDSRFDLG